MIRAFYHTHPRYGAIIIAYGSGAWGPGAWPVRQRVRAGGWCCWWRVDDAPMHIRLKADHTEKEHPNA